MTVLTLPTAEVFGPTFQGEGNHCGRLCSFIRFGTCNLHCSWCDTKETWDSSQYNISETCPDTDVKVSLDKLYAIGAPITIVTGGEPLLHQKKDAWKSFLVSASRFSDVHIETNGTIAPDVDTVLYTAHFSVSPKIITVNDDPEKRRIKPDAIKAFKDIARGGTDVIWKFVAASNEDVRLIVEFVNEYELPTETVYVMPEGIFSDDIIKKHREIAEEIMKHHFNTSTRLHALLWEASKGR